MKSISAQRYNHVEPKQGRVAIVGKVHVVSWITAEKNPKIGRCSEEGFRQCAARLEPGVRFLV